MEMEGEMRRYTRCALVVTKLCIVCSQSRAYAGFAGTAAAPKQRACERAVSVVSSVGCLPERAGAVRRRRREQRLTVASLRQRAGAFLHLCPCTDAPVCATRSHMRAGGICCKKVAGQVTMVCVLQRAAWPASQARRRVRGHRPCRRRIQLAPEGAGRLLGCSVLRLLCRRSSQRRAWLRRASWCSCARTRTRSRSWTRSTS